MKGLLLYKNLNIYFKFRILISPQGKFKHRNVVSLYKKNNKIHLILVKFLYKCSQIMH